MAGFVRAHDPDDCPAALVVLAELLEVSVEMGADLPFRLLDEAEAHGVAGGGGGHRNRDGTGEPRGIEDARVTVEFRETLGAPHEMIAFFGRGIDQCIGKRGVAGHERLAKIQRLGADFAGVIHPHQARGVALFRRFEAGFRHRGGGRRAGGCRVWRAEHAERAIDPLDQAIERGEAPSGGVPNDFRGIQHFATGISPLEREIALTRGRPVRTIAPLFSSLPTSMTTYSASAKDIKRDWYVVDATDKVLGRLATQIANHLRGKHKPEYTPNLDTGDYIVVVNAEKIRVTGNKQTDKIYYRHSGYPGGLKQISFDKLMQKAPEDAINKAVKGMLPRGPLGRAMFRKLKVYAGPEHQHASQQPQALDI